METSERAMGERLLGTYPKDGRNVYAKLARFGPVIQIGEAKDEAKPLFSKLLPHQRIDTITFEEALDLFKLPRTVGTINGEDLVVNVGRYGPYVLYQKKFCSVPKTEDLMTITLEQCLEYINQKNESEAKKAKIILGKHNDLEVSVAIGRYGPYVTYNKRFYAIATDDLSKVTLEDAINAIQKKAEEKGKSKSRGKKK